MTIRQGEIWQVSFFPKVGSEIAKLRPAIVVSSDVIGRLPLKTVVPITDYKQAYMHYPWMVRIAPDPLNRLRKVSAIDCFQIKNFSDKRFIEKIGEIDAELLMQVHETIVKTLDPLYRLQTFS